MMINYDKSMAKELFTKQTQKTIERLVEKTGKPLSHYERKARRMIREMLEDEEDYIDATEALKNWDGKTTISMEEMKKRLGLVN